MMKIDKTKALILASVLVVIMISGGTLLSVFASNYEGKNFSQGPCRPWLGELTDAQKDEIKKTVEDMKEAGATPEEIKEAINTKLDAWGIEVPEKPCGGYLMDQLTEEQRKELSKKMQELRESGASHEELMEARLKMLEEFGIDIDEIPNPIMRRHKICHGEN